jgi:hypothetical protein
LQNFARLLLRTLVHLLVRRHGLLFGLIFQFILQCGQLSFNSLFLRIVLFLLLAFFGLDLKLCLLYLPFLLTALSLLLLCLDVEGLTELIVALAPVAPLADPKRLIELLHLLLLSK